MKRRSQRPFSAPRRGPCSFRPRLEGAEGRLPWGDSLLGVALGTSLAGTALVALTPDWGTGAAPQPDAPPPAAGGGAAAEVLDHWASAPTPDAFLLALNLSPFPDGWGDGPGEPLPVPESAGPADAGGESANAAWFGGTEDVAPGRASGSGHGLAPLVNPARALPPGPAGAGRPGHGSAAGAPAAAVGAAAAGWADGVALAAPARRLGAAADGSADLPAQAAARPEGHTAASPAASRSALREAYGMIPLNFEANVGQTDPRVQFLARGSGYALFLTPDEAVFRLHRPADPEVGGAASALLRMQVIGGNAAAPAAGLSELPGRVNYFIGNDPSRWHTDVPTYGRVEYRGVYDGIDLAYYGNQRQLEYDFVVAPGADPGVIALGFTGAERLEVDAGGDLVVHAGGGQVRQHRPVIYQEVGGVRREVAGGYDLRDGGQVGFWLGAYDANRPLVIDPVLAYSTYLGGSGSDAGWGIAVDAAGSAYVTGDTFSANFPTTPGAFDTTGGGLDAFVTKLNPASSALVYSTYLGGSGSDASRGIAVDGSGSAYVTGLTLSVDFPTTLGAFDTTHNGGPDAFVTKLNPAGSAPLAYSTYLGGSSADEGRGIAVDGLGSAYVTGLTLSANFPTTLGTVDTTYNGNFDAFVTKLNLAGSAPLAYSTYLGGSGSDQGLGIAVDGSGSAYVTGFTQSANFPTTPGAFDTTLDGGIDAFVTKLNPAGLALLLYSTYLGGGATDEGLGIAVDAAGSTYVTGHTSSVTFPTTPGAFDTTFNGAQDAFVTKLNLAASAPLAYSAYLGGSVNDVGRGIAVDAAGSAYVTGFTQSANFPTTPGAFDTTFNGAQDAFVTKLNPAASAPLAYSAYLGGGGSDDGKGIAVDGLGSAYVTGFTQSADFPTPPGAFDPTFNGAQDAFVTKISHVGPPASLLLDPPAAMNPVGSQHSVTATVRDVLGNPAPGVTVRFTVTGSANTGGSATTNAGGQATFSYPGPLQPGADAITAYADTDTDNTQDPGEPAGAATKSWVAGPPASLLLDPPAAMNPVGSQHSVTATVQDAFGNPLPGVTVRFTVTGSVSTGGSATTDAGGQATFSYPGPSQPGADAITAYADTDTDNTQDPGEPAGAATKTWVAGPPATLTLNPPAAANPVGSQHSVTATVQDAFGNPLSGVAVRFTVTGSANTGGSATTNAGGQATFSYTGPPLPGADTITAYADTDTDNTQDPGEPAGAATKAWVLPPTTPLTEVTIVEGGWITAANGDKAAFIGYAHSSESGQTQGQQWYRDLGPAQPLTVRSVNVLAIVLESPTQASIYGQATINGSGSYFYRIRVQDLGEHGRGQDTYGILLQTGYSSGEQVLEGGNVWICRG